MKRIAWLSIAVAGLVACNSDRTLPPGPVAEIQDANHLDGNAFFFWLPPTINQNAPSTQVFSRKLRPIVTIIDQGPANTPSPNCQANNTIRTFSGSEITVSNSAYAVDWHTDLDNLHAECTYRIKVNVGPRLNSLELGYADVDVVNRGSGLKNVDTDEFIPLLDGRTLPIRFFVGVGSTCHPDGGADCGEGVARPDQNTVIVTNSGNAGVFIPAGAVDDETTITIQSVDGRIGEGEECIPGVFGQQFPGTPETTDNACYDYTADPPLADVNDNDGTFNEGFDAIVGICPPSAAMALEHEILDQIVLFRFDTRSEGPVALENEQAPFLRCDPHFSPSFGARGSLFGDLARALASILGPRPLYASSRRSMLFDVGAGGQTDGFSRFTWVLRFEGPSD